MHCTRTGTTFVATARRMAVQTVACCFGLLLTRRGLKATERGLSGTSRLCGMTLTGHRVKRVSRGRLLRLGLSTLGTGTSLARTRDSLGTGVFRLHTFLKIKRSRGLHPIVPRAISKAGVRCGRILDGTLRHGSFTRGVHHQRLRTSCRITATHNGLHDVSLFTDIKCAKRGHSFPTICGGLRSGRVIRINIGVPVLS